MSVDFPGIFRPEIIQLGNIHHELHHDGHLQSVALPAAVPIPQLDPFRLVVFMSQDHTLTSILVMMSPRLLCRKAEAVNLCLAVDGSHMVAVRPLEGAGPVPDSGLFDDLVGALRDLGFSFSINPPIRGGG